MDSKYICQHLIKLVNLIHETTRGFAYETESGKFVFGIMKKGKKKRNIVSRNVAIYLIVGLPYD